MADGRNLKLFYAFILLLIILLHVSPSLSLGFNHSKGGVPALGNNAAVADANTTAMRCIEREREALLAFKQGLVDNYNILSSWGREAKKQDCCSWSGVECDNQTGHVIKLDPPFEGLYLLQGNTFSPKLIELQYLEYLDLSAIYFNDVQLQMRELIGSLTNLRYLDLHSAGFSGQFPYQLGNLTQLQYLDLSSNSFTNAENLNWLLPLSSLTYLDLSDINLNNVFDWVETLNKLPQLRNLTLSNCGIRSPLFLSTLSHINSSKSLAHVDLSSNDITTTSSVFPWLSNYNTSLVHLDLSDHQLTGSMPELIGSLTNLRYLDLSSDVSNAGFRGQIPYNLGNLTQLQYLDLSSNSFINAENLNWLLPLSSLTYLDLSGTNLSNVFDWRETVNKLPQLRNLTLSYCGLGSPLFLSTLSHINSSKSLAHVDLRGNDLTTASSVFPWLSNYNTSLVHLDLSINHLTGSIPDVFGDMSSLSYLYLSSNQLEGGIPESMGRMSWLKGLLISTNRLSGRLPESIGKMSSLKYLDLSSNQLEGGIPESIGKMSSLEDVDLSGNQLNGTVPESMGKLSKLNTLNLGTNSLKGVISETHFSNLSNLHTLDMSFNSLVFSFNDDWVPPFQLSSIKLESCNMGPNFPKWLQTQKSFSILDISDAGISDIIPSWFWHSCHQARIRNIDLSNNRIKGTLPEFRLEFVVVPHLNFSRNQLEGPIPSFLSTASSLDLSNNKISGLISFFCANKSTSYLNFLDLSSNNVSEELPDCWTHLENLVFLDLSDNAFFGKIPTTMGSLFSLETLKLNNNGFVGDLPSSLKNCRNLVVFDVGENKLSGLIPKWLGAGLPDLTILILRSNHFNGSIPSQLCHLTHIQILDFSINNISGSIPKCLNSLSNLAQKGYSSLTINHKYITDQLAGPYHRHGHYMGSGSYDDETSLIWKRTMSKYKSTLGLVKSIHLSSNRLTGEIPIEITDLVGLVSLNLSRNNLTGHITQKIGKLELLQSLDLSRNKLDGGIPTSLLQIYGLGVLDVSNNNLSGEIPMGSQIQNFDPSAFAGNPLLCGIPLQKTCSPKQPGVFRNEDEDEDEDELISHGFYICMGLGFAAGFWGVCGSLIIIKSWRYTFFKFLNVLEDWFYVRVELIRRRWILKR